MYGSSLHVGMYVRVRGFMVNPGRMNGDAQPFDLAGSSKVGILCVHGFTGTPFEMRYFGQRLHELEGWTVVGPTLAGHGDDPTRLAETGWRDWLGSVERAHTALAARCERVAVCGLSLGSLLSLELSRRRREVRALCAMATPLWLSPVATTAIRVANSGLVGWLTGGRGVRIRKVRGASDVRDDAMRARNPALPAMPLKPLQSLLEFAAYVRIGVPDVPCPVLVAHGRRDHTAPPRCSDELYTRLAARGVPTEKLDLPGSFHVITIDVERELLVQRAARFLEQWV